MERPNIGDVLTLNIEKLSSDGSGIARTENGVVFVAGALPGETVRAKVTALRKDFTSARTLQVEKPASGRITPRCRHFGTCGGCQLQHASYELQLKLKADILKDAMTRIGGFDLSDNDVVCEASPEQWGYRNKASFPVQSIRGRLTAGFYQADSHRLVRLDGCPVNAKPIEALYRVIQDELLRLPLSAYDERTHTGTLRHTILRSGRNTGQTLVSFVVNGRLSAKDVKAIASVARPLKPTTLTMNHNSRRGNVILGSRTEALIGSGLIEEQLEGWTFSFDTSSFFQVNTDQAEKLYSHVRDKAGKNSSVLELYSGVGSMTCYLAGGRVTAVEEWPSAVELAELNMRANGFEGKVKNICARAEDAMIDLQGENYDCVVVDPPRSGCERSVLEAVNSLDVPRVVYVSCNPATLARDAKILAGYGYSLTSIRAFDMFPQTVHVESVALLEKR